MIVAAGGVSDLRGGGAREKSTGRCGSDLCGGKALLPGSGPNKRSKNPCDNRRRPDAVSESICWDDAGAVIASANIAAAHNRAPLLRSVTALRAGFAGFDAIAVVIIEPD
jgi:hypothetical protein